jgi:hypothetical protein
VTGKSIEDPQWWFLDNRQNGETGKKTARDAKSQRTSQMHEYHHNIIPFQCSRRQKDKNKRKTIVS